MKIRVCVLVAVLTLALLGGMAWGYPTRFGPVSGLVDMPTADVVPVSGAEFAADYTKLNDTTGTKVWPLRLLVGLGYGVEAGFGYAKLQDGGSSSITSFGVKKSVQAEPASSFSLAVGASFVNAPVSDLTSIYVAGTKEFKQDNYGPYSTQTPRLRTRGHAGLMYSRRGGLHDSEVKPFVGFDLSTPQGASFVGEYKWSKFGEDTAAAAFRYPITPSATAQLGVSRAGTVLGQDDFRLMLGFSYSFTVPTEAAGQ